MGYLVNNGYKNGAKNGFIAGLMGGLIIGILSCLVYFIVPIIVPYINVDSIDISPIFAALGIMFAMAVIFSFLGTVCGLLGSLIKYISKLGGSKFNVG